MATNFYFQSGVPGGRSSEQLLMEDIIIECLKIYGFDTYYLPRHAVNEDKILGEDVLNDYPHAYPLEMYMQNVSGFEGDGDLMSKFGVEIRDTATFVVARRRWDETVARTGNAVLTTRPAEGDIVYFPLTKAFFEIKRVEATDPFFQVGKLYVYKLECELYRYSSESFTTGIDEIDSEAAGKSTDTGDFNLVLETGDRMLLESFTPSAVILESFKLDDILPNTQNDQFTSEISVLDFTEHNPFGEINA
ncbi:neck protein [uncultured Caudovirales phage]|uniref:Neck protein n=1 Tax=uncultured Caudovirales phage TaxID=2100421 RepID=A0A6J7WW00_9CAUD|nr:neck protein [uncultured Caudovirales phage]